MQWIVCAVQYGLRARDTVDTHGNTDVFNKLTVLRYAAHGGRLNLDARVPGCRRAFRNLNKFASVLILSALTSCVPFMLSTASIVLR
jgi:hypothetical protein